MERLSDLPKVTQVEVILGSKSLDGTDSRL